MGVKRVIYGLPIMKAYRDHRTRQLAERHADHFAGFRFAGRATHAETYAIVSVEQARDWAGRGAICEVGRSNYLFLPA